MWIGAGSQPNRTINGGFSPEADIAADAKRAMAEILMAIAVDVALAARGHGDRTHDRHVTEVERVRLSPR